jgi:hypothetical protein
MAPHCGNAGGKKKKLSPDAFFAWLDEETFIDVKQPKKRRSTSAPPPPTGRKTYIKPNNHNPSLEVAADNELKKASKRINGTSNGTNGTASRCRSAATSEEDRRKLCETNKSSEKQKSLKKALAMGKRIGDMRQQEQQRFATEERLAAPSSIYGRKNLAGTNDCTCKNSSLEETLAIASQSHFMHFAADKNLKAPKKKRSSASLNDIPIRGRSKVVPSFWQQSSDEALASASAKGKRLRDNRRRQQQQYHHQRQQIEKEKLIDMKVRNTPLSGISRRTFDTLPAGPLNHVASYLTALSRVLFDVALYGIDTMPCTSDGSGVAGNQLNILDFGEIERSLAYDLRDRHIKAILLRIDAVNKVKRLKLTNCLNITGAGLEPLRGSRIIEQIDLSIVSNRWRGWGIFYPTPQIVYHHVVPILDSIIESEGCVLKHLQFPKVWRNDDDAFLTRYNEMLRNRGRICCFECDRRNSYPRVEDVLERRAVINFHQTSPRKIRRVQTNTCSNCLNHYCHVCVRNEEPRLRFCSKGCEKYYCSDCTTFNSCDVCRKKFCAGCETFTDCCTSQCDRKICSDCILNHRCEKCNRTWCERCEYSGPIKLYNFNEGHVQCTSCLSCADCGDTGDSVHLDSCTRCQKYLCESCFGFGYDAEYWDDYCDKDVCESCLEIGRNEGYYGHRGRYVVYGDDFARAPICDM